MPTAPYTVVPQIVDKAAPGANTDILADDFTLPHEGHQDVTIQVAVAVAGKVNLVMKPGSTLTGAKATGSIQAIAGASLVDGDFFTLKDGVHTKAFEFNSAGGVTAGRVAIAIVGSETAAAIALLIVAAVNGVGSGLTLTASVNEDDDTIVDLVNDDYGSVGNIANTETVADAGFTVSGMTGGYGGNVTALLDINGAANLAVDALYSKTYRLQSGYAYNLQLTVDGIVRALAVTSQQ